MSARSAAAPAAAARVAVIGTGSAGSRHLRVLAAIGGVTTLAVPARAERRRELESAGQACAADPGEAARQGATHAIIATDTGRHAADAASALAAGLHVLVEKPLAIDAAEAAVVAQAAVRSGRRAFVGCTLRFSEALGWARQALTRLGRLHAVRIECGSYLPEWRPGRSYQSSYSSRPGEGGVLRDLIHEIDYAGWCFGWPAAVSARLIATGRLDIGAEDAADLCWDAPGGGTVTVHVDYLTRPARRGLWAAGEHGTVTWDGMRGEAAVAAGGGTDRIRPDQPRDAMFEAQARAFLASCDGAPDARLATVEDGVRALAICDAARRSDASGRREPV